MHFGHCVSGPNRWYLAMRQIWLKSMNALTPSIRAVYFPGKEGTMKEWVFIARASGQDSKHGIWQCVSVGKDLVLAEATSFPVSVVGTP